MRACQVSGRWARHCTKARGAAMCSGEGVIVLRCQSRGGGFAELARAPRQQSWKDHRICVEKGSYVEEEIATKTATGLPPGSLVRLKEKKGKEFHRDSVVSSALLDHRCTVFALPAKAPLPLPFLSGGRSTRCSTLVNTAFTQRLLYLSGYSNQEKLHLHQCAFALS